jgi:hypothetical protein
VFLGSAFSFGILYLGKPIEKPLEPAANSVTLTRLSVNAVDVHDKQNTQSIVQGH